MLITILTILKVLGIIFSEAVVFYWMITAMQISVKSVTSWIILLCLLMAFLLFSCSFYVPVSLLGSVQPMELTTVIGWVGIGALVVGCLFVAKQCLSAKRK